ncbi:hypothetical protein BDZ89DRAFT_730475 [Hymenopellis radicata]|nr:hypothetical protein BDZ89DRAFT_730475 [Hymenopellis radicata]
MAILSSSPLQREFIVQILIYALGLITSPSTLSFGAVLFAGIIHLGLLPMLWPPSLLRALKLRSRRQRHFFMKSVPVGGMQPWQISARAV